MVTGSHLLERLSTSVWYVRPEFLQTMQNILELKFVDNLKVDQIKELLRVDEKNEELQANTPYNVVGRKMIIDIKGTLVNEASWLDACCGFVGMDKISTLLSAAEDDPKIDHVILRWSSPGGTAIGCEALSNQVYALRNKKRVTSLAAEQMCSAAYFIGSAADEVYAEDPVSHIGSIGSLLLHVDQSKMDSDRGLKFTYISAGKYKTLGNPHEPLNPEAYSELQNSINYCYEVFLKAVQRNRGISAEEAASMAEGRVYNAGQAPKIMLDGITSLNDILSW